MLSKFMLFNIFGVILVIVGIGGVIFTLNNKNDMPRNVYGLQKEKYQVIDKDKFNNIMATQSIVEFTLILLTGVLYIISKDPEYFVFASWYIFPRFFFSKKAKKYIKIE